MCEELVMGFVRCFVSVEELLLVRFGGVMFLLFLFCSFELSLVRLRDCEASQVLARSAFLIILHL